MFFDLAFVLAFALLSVYTAWQLVSLWGWCKTIARSGREPLTNNHLRTTATGQPTIALLVPFRNEASNLPDLLASLLAQDYPGRLELIFIDDHSTDGGAALLPTTVTRLNLADYLKGRLTVAHKKAALTYAISSTTADVIITTDADCHWPPDRVSRIAAAFAGGADVVLGPVLIRPAEGLLNAFQALDLAAYQFLTAATAHQGRPALANGANFSFRRALFRSVGGYRGVDHLPSGDDVLLLHKFYQRDLSAANHGTTDSPQPTTDYLPSASVSTRPAPGWRALWRQRLRWAGKAGNYTNPKLTFAQALAFALSFALVTALLTLPLHLRPRPLILLWSGKALIDGICLWRVMLRFGQGTTLKWYPAAAVIYPFFLVGVGTAALLGFTTNWKGRG